MGYEIKIIVGTKSLISSDPAAYLQVIGEIDLCKPGYDSNIYLLNKNNRTFPKGYTYHSDGNTKMIVDSYGEDLLHYPIDIVLESLKKDCKADNYRRFKVARDFLESIKKNFSENEEITCFLYGHWLNRKS